MNRKFVLLIVLFIHVSLFSEKALYKKTYYSPGIVKECYSFFVDDAGKIIRHGSYEKFSKKGNLVEKGSYHRDKKEGHWILIERPFYRSEGSFHRDNKLGIWKKFKGKLLKSKQKYYLGRLDGVSYEYFSNGNLKNQIEYSNGAKKGLSKEWYPDGQLKVDAYYVKDRLHGNYSLWNSQGQLIANGSYCQGVPEGKWQWFDALGQLIKESFLDKEHVIFYKYNTEASYPYKEKVITLLNNLPHGEEKTFFPSGSLHKIYHFLEGKKHGVYLRKNPEGDVVERGEYKSDEPYGIFKEYFIGKNKDKVKQQTLYKENGIIERKSFDLKGNLKTEVMLRGSLKHGTYQRFNETGKIIAKGSYLYDKKQGLWEYFDPEGRIKKKAVFIAGKLHGPYQSYYTTHPYNQRKKGNYFKGKKHGMWSIWENNKNLKSEVHYTLGVVDGLYQEFWPTLTREGTPKLKVSGYYLDGNKDGEWKSWYSNGLIKSKIFFELGFREGKVHQWYSYLIENKPVLQLVANYSVGNKSGVWKLYYKNGNKRLFQSYHNGVLHGDSYKFFPNNQVKLKESFNKGTKHGEVVIYYLNGKLRRKLLYMDGNREGIEQGFYENGEQAYEGLWQSNLRQGTWKWFSSKKTDVILKEISFNKGKGTLYQFYSNGEKKSQTSFSLGGELNGLASYWYRNGSIKRFINYHNGLRNGSYQRYSSKDKLLEESQWKEGKKEGWSYRWYGNQQMRQKIYYSNGLPHGIYTEWDEKGSISLEGGWKYGLKEGDWKWYDRKGKVVKKLSFSHTIE